MRISQFSFWDLELRKMHCDGNCFGIGYFHHAVLHIPTWNKCFVTSRVKDNNLEVIAVASCAAIKK